MRQMNLTVRYIAHSGFQVETENNLFIFDFYQGFPQLKAKNITIFSSHIHSDHYNPQIFEWRREYPNIQYILSSDIRNEQSVPKESSKITFLSPYEEITMKDVRIKAYNSTDEGVSFLIQADGVRIFHAGDLNWWYWQGDSPEGIEIAEKTFKEEIAKIKGETIDIAFFPVDPRLEEFYCFGAEYFIQEIKPKILIPMHFSEDYEAIKKFRTRMKGSSTYIIDLQHKGQIVTLTYS